VQDIISNLIANLIFIFERLSWTSVVDILLVAAIFFGIFMLLRGTQAMVVLRGALLLIILVGALTSLEVLPAFSWMVRTTFPALIFVIPVIFAPEIRHALERLGRAGILKPTEKSIGPSQKMINAIVSATARLSDKRHGALIVLQRNDNLDEYVETGVRLDSDVTPELILQIFYPNTPLHDGAVIISDYKMIAAACVLPLSASGVLDRSPDRQMGLRHRASLGITEVSDSIAVVVSEETGAVSIVHGGRIIRRLDSDRLENILNAFFRSESRKPFLQRFFNRKEKPHQSNPGGH
jgi:diadenylate cyclase